MLVDLEQALIQTRPVTRERLAQRGKGYVWLLRGLEHSGILLLDRDRGKMVETDYLWMRDVDDVVDGHLPLPAGYATPVEYIQRKLDFLQTGEEPIDTVENLMLLSQHLSAKTRIPLDYERGCILGSMLFDAQRVGTGNIYLEAVLNEYFYQLDIEGTTRGSLKVFGEVPEKSEYLEPLGRATRIYYNLRDFEEDVTTGYINISREDCDRLGITLDDLHDENSPLIRAWFVEQATKGLDLLAQHRVLVTQAHFGKGLRSLVGRALLPLNYERPARKFFEMVLS